eukprot:scaffold1461_cov86-Phaeocystis_antarctica.AAC.1
MGLGSGRTHAGHRAEREGCSQPPGNGFGTLDLKLVDGFLGRGFLAVVGSEALALLRKENLRTGCACEDAGADRNGSCSDSPGHRRLRFTPRLHVGLKPPRRLSRACS